jgi:hypothetical protein
MSSLRLRPLATIVLRRPAAITSSFILPLGKLGTFVHSARLLLRIVAMYLRIASFDSGLHVTSIHTCTYHRSRNELPTLWLGLPQQRKIMILRDLWHDRV